MMSGSRTGTTRSFRAPFRQSVPAGFSLGNDLPTSLRCGRAMLGPGARGVKCLDNFPTLPPRSLWQRQLPPNQRRHHRNAPLVRAATTAATAEQGGSAARGNRDDSRDAGPDEQRRPQLVQPPQLDLLQLGPRNDYALLRSRAHSRAVQLIRKRHAERDAAVRLLEQLPFNRPAALAERRLQAVGFGARYAHPHALPNASA